MKERLRFGIIGCGTIAARFANALNQSGEGRLYAVAARDQARADAFMEKFGAEVSYGDYDALINDPMVEGVYIATVNTTHVPLVKKCIAAHKPVLCEKPLFTQGDDEKALAAYAKAENVLVVEAMWTRMQPAFRKVKEWIADGKIGEVKLMSSHFCFRIPYNDYTKSNRLFDPETAGGAVLDVGVYLYEFFTGIMDEPPVYFSGLQTVHETGVDESTALTLKFQNGAIAQGFSSIGSAYPEDAVIAGTKGSIFMPVFWKARSAELKDASGNVIDSFTDPVEEGFVNEAAHFVSLVREGKKESPYVPMADSIDFIEKIRTCSEGL